MERAYAVFGHIYEVLNRIIPIEDTWSEHSYWRSVLCVCLCCCCKILRWK